MMEKTFNQVRDKMLRSADRKDAFGIAYALAESEVKLSSSLTENEYAHLSDMCDELIKMV